MLNPFLAVQTKANLTASGTDSAYGSFAGRSGSIGHTQATSYDGVTFITSAAITGTVRVYGYSKGSLTQPQTIQPYSMSAGNATAVGTGGTTASATVTFPVGRFSQAPIVTTSFTQGSIYFSNANAITSSGFTLILRDRNDTAITGSFTTNWQALQMTSSSGAG
jgi:hypothetical protein